MFAINARGASAMLRHGARRSSAYRFKTLKVPPGYGSNSSKTSWKLSATAYPSETASELRESYLSDVPREGAGDVLLSAADVRIEQIRCLHWVS
jgi:hypothetical protein